jgi:hypothetical protein
MLGLFIVDKRLVAIYLGCSTSQTNFTITALRKLSQMTKSIYKMPPDKIGRNRILWLVRQLQQPVIQTIGLVGCRLDYFPRMISPRTACPQAGGNELSDCD